jgi:hypothetical protein
MRLAPLGTALLCASLPVAGCICQNADSATTSAVKSRELASFDFVAKPQPALLSLWPPDPTTPRRKKRQMLTTQDGVNLLATVDGVDPFFTWDFERPLRAGSLSIELDAEKAGDFQLFWATDECKTFEERCSATLSLPAGQQSVAFIVDPTTIAVARSAGRQGMKVGFRRIFYSDRSRVWLRAA